MYKEEKNSEMRPWTQPGSAVILGLSGGGDSVYLLHALCELRKEQAFDLQAVHIHHGLRGEAADADEAFCENLCEELQVPFLAEHINVKEYAQNHGMTLEQAGREVRYDVFYREARRILRENPLCRGVNIFLAHHANDQEETVLMNFLRGSGPAGLSGMQPCTEVFSADGRPVRLVRPLLHMTHEQLLMSLRQRGFSWCEDATNQELHFTRNRLRNEVLPKIRELSPGFTQICSREAALFSEIADYMSQEAEHMLAQHLQRQDGLVTFPADVLRTLHPALRHTVVRKCIDRACGLRDISAAHVDAVEALLDMQSGRRVNLPRGVSVDREFDRLCFRTGAEAPGGQSDTALFWEIAAANGAEFLKNLEKYRSERYTKWFDYDKIIKYCGEGAPVMRSPMEGDYLFVNRQGQRKRLALYLKQEKIPKRLRSEIQVVAWNDVILWVPEHRISAYFFITDETKNILRLQVGPKE